MYTNRRLFVTSALTLFAAGCVSAPQAAAPLAPARPRPRFGSFGVDLASRDLSVRPGDDFNLYCSGSWMRANEIPADRASWGTSPMLSAEVQDSVKALVEETAAAGGAPGSNAQKVGDYYNAFMDVDAINARGMAPARAGLDAIAALRTHADVWSFVCAPENTSVGFGTPATINFPIQLFPLIDARDPDKYCIIVTHAGLGLPDRDYYLRDDEQFPELRSQYQAHIARQLTNAGLSDGERKAQNILALETRIARLHWPVERRRDVVATYNKKTRAELIALNSRFPWAEGLSRAGLTDLGEYVVAELDTMRPLSQLVLSTPVAQWRDYLTFQYIAAHAQVLPANVDAENFAFFGTALNGQPEQRQRWKRAIEGLDNALGEAVGQAYVARHFPESSKSQMLELVENMRRAYGERINTLTWMSEETKAAAREKLATFRPKIGYPDRWRDYSAYEVRAGDAFGNLQRSAAYEWRRQIGRLDQPTDRDEWYMSTFTVNAYYNPSWNEIVFPAAILQPPYFDPAADAAVIYGGIGSVIGHEMGHGFDDQGAKSDAHGVLRDWWSADDVTRFSALVDELAAQYDTFSPFPGIHVNGRLTLGENIGDLGGLEVAYQAYKISLNGQEAPVLDGITGDQRFFLGYGQGWKRLTRDAALRNQILSNPHSPAQYRVNGVVRNHDAWYAAFDVQPGDALYLAPEDRVHIW
ncbi:MAG: M13 family metallopeptidase [Hyphomonadaceae bacterium]